MGINSVSNQGQSAAPTPTLNQQMGQQDFLRLMTAQLSQQDPFNPVDNQQMVAQMAQFSSLAGITETNTTLQQISDQLKAQTALLQEIKASGVNPAPTTNPTQEG